MKYIIDIEDKPLNKANLYRARKFKTLVFDQYGLEQLEPLTPRLDAKEKEGYKKGIEAMYAALKVAYERDSTKQRIAPSIKQFVLNHTAQEFIAAAYSNKCTDCELRKRIAKVFGIHWIGEEDCPFNCEERGNLVKRILGAEEET